MQGPSSFVILQAQQIIISGTGVPGNGLFVYSGGEAIGNLIAQIVAPGVTLDPVGDQVQAVLNVGHWGPTGLLLQHMGVDANGNVYIADNTGLTRILIANGGNSVWAQMEPAIIFYNAFGAIIQVVDPQRGGNFQYEDNNSATQGVLIGAQVGKNTTDPINGRAISAGITIIDPAFGDTLSVIGANINFGQAPFTKNALDTANQGSTNQGPFRSIAAPEQTQAGHVVQRWYGTSPDGTRAAGTVISLTDPPVRNTSDLLEVQGDITVTNAIRATGGTVSDRTQIITDTWHNFALVNGWANVGAAARYKMLAENRVAVSVNISSAGATAFQFSSVAAPYIPARDVFIAAGATANVASGEAPFLEVDTAGNVTMNGLHAFSTAGGWVCMGSYELD